MLESKPRFSQNHSNDKQQWKDNRTTTQKSSVVVVEAIDMVVLLPFSQLQKLVTCQPLPYIIDIPLKQIVMNGYVIASRRSMALP